MQSDDTGSVAPATKRKLPRQLANETRMVDAAITLLGEHTVAEVTNVAVASASQTQPSYVTRYFGSRDEFLLAVAEELASRIAARNLGLQVLLAAPDSTTRITGIFTVPEVESWFKLWRYLVGTDLLERSTRLGDGPLLTAGIENLQRELGFPPEEARSWALVTLILVFGYRVSGGVLGITTEEAAVGADKIIGALLRDAEAHRDGTSAPAD
jgi:AcrR family transcriptional regulator